MAALDRLTAALLAHGGAGGAIVEVALLLALVGLAALVWLGGRRRGAGDGEDRQN